MKDGPEGETVLSKLKSIEVGIDSDGDPITLRDDTGGRPIAYYSAGTKADEEPDDHVHDPAQCGTGRPDNR